ncbi:MAG: DUF4474 domain-containing protein [Clostridia bacterium]|nr:DUF4474 domain-containing protein [Clostridia bacterium]
MQEEFTTQGTAAVDSSAQTGDAARPAMTKRAKTLLLLGFAFLIVITLMGGILLAGRDKQTEDAPQTPAVAIPATDAAPAKESRPLATMTLPPAETTLPTTAVPATTAAPTTQPLNTTAPIVTAAPAPAPTAASATEITMFRNDPDEYGIFSQVLYRFGFLYNADQNMFYTQNDPWQRNFGFTALYDDMAVLGDMYYDTVRFKFKYDGRIWMYQIWKGRYGATSGCEMGVYWQDARTDNRDFFHTPADDDPLPGMYLELYRYEDFMFKNGPAKHWWLTGFRLFESTKSEGLRMKMTYYMPNKEMADAFEFAVKEQCGLHSNLTYTRTSDEISMDWAY